MEQLGTPVYTMQVAPLFHSSLHFVITSNGTVIPTELSFVKIVKTGSIEKNAHIVVHQVNMISSTNTNDHDFQLIETKNFFLGFIEFLA